MSDWTYRGPGCGFNKVGTAPSLAPYYRAKFLEAVERSDLDTLLRATTQALRARAAAGLYSPFELRWAVATTYGLHVSSFPEELVSAVTAVGLTVGILEAVTPSPASLERLGTFVRLA